MSTKTINDRLNEMCQDNEDTMTAVVAMEAGADGMAASNTLHSLARYLPEPAGMIMRSLMRILTQTHTIRALRVAAANGLLDLEADMATISGEDAFAEAMISASQELQLAGVEACDRHIDKDRALEEGAPEHD